MTLSKVLTFLSDHKVAVATSVVSGLVILYVALSISTQSNQVMYLTNLIVDLQQQLDTQQKQVDALAKSAQQVPPQQQPRQPQQQQQRMDHMDHMVYANLQTHQPLAHVMRAAPSPPAFLFMGSQHAAGKPFKADPPVLEEVFDDDEGDCAEAPPSAHPTPTQIVSQLVSPEDLDLDLEAELESELEQLLHTQSE